MADNFGIISTNVLGGTLVIKPTIDLTGLKFTPDPDLVGKPIRLMEASGKYGVPHPTISQWATAGLVRVMERGPKLLVMDEATVARACAIFKYVRDLTSPRRAAWVLKKVIATMA